MRKIPIAGTKRNRLRLTGVYCVHGTGKKAFVEYEVECVCGTLLFVRANSFWGGHAKSCGCLKREVAAQVAKENCTTHGMSGTPEYDAYTHARNRCNNSEDIGYKNWGGRGIKFLFTSFEQFFAELGNKPEPKYLYSVDRINNEGNYEEGNVRWATEEQQANNKRSLKGKPWSEARRRAQHA